MASAFTLEDRVILACARTDADVSRLAALSVLRPDWDVVARKTERWGMIPLVDAHLRRIDGVPAAVATRLRQIRHRETLHGVARAELLRLILTRFAEARLPVIVLKGAALAALVYPSPALRPMRDIDLLIHAEDERRSHEIIGTLRDAFDAADAPARNPYLRTEGLRALDVSRDFFLPTGAPGPFPIADLWARANLATMASREAQVFCPEDLILHLAFHLTLVTGFEGQVRALCDIGEVCRRYRAAIAWTPLVRRACAYGIGRELHTALHLAHAMVGAAVPESAFAGLEDRLRERPTDAELAAAEQAIVADETPKAASTSTGEASGAAVSASARDAARIDAAARSITTSSRPGEVAVTHDQGMTDGVGSQLHRIFGFYALARALGVKYVHSGMRDVGYQGLMPMLTGTQDPTFTARYNAFFTLPSDAFDVEGSEIVRVHSVDLPVIERCQAHAANTGRAVLIRGHLPYEYINAHPAGYQALRDVSPYRDHRPSGPVRICVHVRRGDNSVQSRAHEFPSRLLNDYYVRVCRTVARLLDEAGVPFIVRVHTEAPPRPYTLHPGIHGMYFTLERPSMIDPADAALEEFDAVPNRELVLNVEPRLCIDDFATADVLVLSRSSLGFVGGLLNPHGCVLCPEGFHAPLPDWIVVGPDGRMDTAALDSRLTRQLSGRVSMAGPQV
jgi:hypothetical protein